MSPPGCLHVLISLIFRNYPILGNQTRSLAAKKKATRMRPEDDYAWATVYFDATVTHFQPSGTLCAALGRPGVSVWILGLFWVHFVALWANLQCLGGCFGRLGGTSGGVLVAYLLILGLFLVVQGALFPDDCWLAARRR